MIQICNCCGYPVKDYIIDKDLGYVCFRCQEILGKDNLEEVSDIKLSSQHYYCDKCGKYLPIRELELTKNGKFLCNKCSISELPDDEFETWYKEHPYAGTKKIYFIITSDICEELDRNLIKSKVGLDYLLNLTDDNYETLLFVGKVTHKKLIDIIEGVYTDCGIRKYFIREAFEYIPSSNSGYGYTGNEGAIDYYMDYCGHGFHGWKSALSYLKQNGPDEW